MDENFHDHLPQLFPHTDARSWFADNLPLRQVSAIRNSSLQGAYFIIAARALGLDTGPMSGFDNDAVDKAFFADQPNERHGPQRPPMRHERLRREPLIRIRGAHEGLVQPTLLAQLLLIQQLVFHELRRRPQRPSEDLAVSSNTLGLP